MADVRDKLRALTVGARKSFRSEIVKWGGEEFEVRQPTAAAWGEIYGVAGVSLSGKRAGEISMAQLPRLRVEAAIRCTFAPGTDTAVFDEADRDGLLGQPAGSGFVETIGDAALRLMQSVPQADAKNSEPPPGESSSSA